ncbi:MAG: hypothetical protein A2Z96_07210 [Spirochaetes bacterium GWB1_48_6]|nr:MAG: hypothetical protein A2Z96_07210 [Spirochaetes bacterium GWB1_48_6]
MWRPRQAPGTLCQVLLGVFLLQSCQEAPRPSGTTWYLREADGFRELGGFEDLPETSWLSWEESTIPTDFDIKDNQAFLLINRKGISKVLQEGGSLSLTSLAPAGNFNAKILHGLWNWNDKWFVATRPLNLHTLIPGGQPSTALFYWTPQTQEFLPLPMGTQTQDPQKVNIFLSPKPGFWDLIWESPTEEIKYTRYNPLSGEEEVLSDTSEEFWARTDPATWESLNPSWAAYLGALDLPAGDVLLGLWDQDPDSPEFFLHHTPHGGILRSMALETTWGKGILLESGSLAFSTTEQPEIKLINLPRVYNLTYPWFFLYKEGLVLVWIQKSGKTTGNWGLTWIPHPQRL